MVFASKSLHRIQTGEVMTDRCRSKRAIKSSLLLLGLLALFSFRTVDSFQPIVGTSTRTTTTTTTSSSSSRWRRTNNDNLGGVGLFAHLSERRKDGVLLSASPTANRNRPGLLLALEATGKDEHGESPPSRRRKVLRKLSGAKGVLKALWKGKPSRRKLRNVLLGLAIAVSGSSVLAAKPGSGHAASAPVMAMPKAEGRDPATEAISEHERRMAARAQRELNDAAARARRIEAEQGERARVKFEKEFKQEQERKAEERAKGLTELKRSLLDQGLCPFTDLEGQRQVTLYKTGVDLGEVPGTQFYLEKEWERSAPKRSAMVKKAANRKVIACMVRDMKNRDVDPLEYFEKHQDQTEAILEMDAARAQALVQKYTANLEQYGQIIPPKEGEMSAKEKMALAEKKKGGGGDKEAKRAAREEAKRLKAEEKARAKAAKEVARRLKQEERAKAKAAKQAAKTAAGAGVSAADVGTTGEAAAGVVEDTVSSVEAQYSGELSAEDEMLLEDADGVGEAVALPTKKQISGKLPIVPATVAIVAAGGGGYAIKLYRDKAAADEEERRRQFRLLMGDDAESMPDEPSRASALEEVDTDLDVSRTTPPAPKTVAEAPAPAPKKKKLGLKGVFGKKKNDRETDIMVLVGSDAQAPELAAMLAKLLTFGAPGRFPAVVSLPGGMPMHEFDLEAAKTKLTEAVAEAGITLEESAEVFANVVNCMLIDIVDLASTSLKEKDDKALVNAINIVVDFMNHAASLYDSVAGGVTIKPVTYGGDLSKSKLEQMYGNYAGSAITDMENLADDFDARVAMLRDVFQINEKKAEGLIMKAMQKNMIEMLKTGKGMEGMENMMQSMGGLDGLPPGFEGANGEGPSPEQLKEMLTALKEMKDSGTIPQEEFEQVKKQFNEAFGSSIDEVVKGASDDEEMTETDKELLALMKAIMED